MNEGLDLADQMLRENLRTFYIQVIGVHVIAWFCDKCGVVGIDEQRNIAFPRGFAQVFDGRGSTDGAPEIGRYNEKNFATPFLKFMYEGVEQGDGLRVQRHLVGFGFEVAIDFHVHFFETRLPAFVACFAVQSLDKIGTDQIVIARVVSVQSRFQQEPFEGRGFVQNGADLRVTLIEWAQYSGVLIIGLRLQVVVVNIEDHNFRRIPRQDTFLNGTEIRRTLAAATGIPATHAE
ncbi:MAG: hypothetical protein DYG98_24680 [Haliscomenobacteraceae bacterium CHB4]|nr:hypothetical protein [Haliscomenobacteraceae bacterium CHB4]